jgi:ATP-dependent Lhr-like helicase
MEGAMKVVPDNFAVKIQGDDLGLEPVRQVIEELRTAGFWADSETQRKLLSLVPEYRLSKFQRVLPDRWQVELVGGCLLDFAGIAAILGRA